VRAGGRLIHLNGPPGIGKSTIASVFAGRHPGVLNLDIDRVAAMTGCWGDNFGDSFEAGRLLAAAMARVHLRLTVEQACQAVEAALRRS
jgi:predicted ABC-type ATPase